jgi:hypothetical protein
MTMSRFSITHTLTVAALLLASPGLRAQTIFSVARSGEMSYHDWNFRWNVGSKSEGLELFDVRYKGTKVLHKGSMPVVKVKYRGDESGLNAGCGPYADRLCWSNMTKVKGATSKVTVRFFSGRMELAVYSKIGGYHLYQAWYFHQDGRMQPMLYSKGWSCGHNPKSRRDHRHHPYWRLDFDIVGASNNLVTEFRRPSGASAWTASSYSSERDAFRSASGDSLYWTIGRSGSPKHVVVSYPGNELRDAPGKPWFSYTNKDAGARLYKGSEDSGWTFGSTGHLGLRSPAENINAKDVVFWSVGHLTHLWTSSDHSHPQWHSSGPVVRAVW